MVPQCQDGKGSFQQSALNQKALGQVLPDKFGQTKTSWMKACVFNNPLETDAVSGCFRKQMASRHIHGMGK